MQLYVIVDHNRAIGVGVVESLYTKNTKTNFILKINRYNKSVRNIPKSRSANVILFGQSVDENCSIRARVGDTFLPLQEV